MGSKLVLAKMERVALRDIWPDEARDFTPWLAGNEGIALVGNVTGLNLEVVDTEVSVGRFSADILAKSKTDEDHKVIIENQLGKTDHDHLGKVITYAAGLGAKTLIWVSDEFCDEHREALDWLNGNSGEQLAFWGLEIRAFRIDGSRPAPQFAVISGPNAATKAVREKFQSAGTPSEVELMACASERQIEPLVKALLKLGPPDEYVTPSPARSYGGSFSCWRKDTDGKPRMVIGINVSGKRKQTPQGQLDIWIPIASMAAVTGISADEVRGFLAALPVYVKEGFDWIFRIANESDANKVVGTLKDLFEKHLGFYASSAE